jgi:hypothetical protein
MPVFPWYFQADQLAIQQLTEQPHEALAIHSGQPHPPMSDLVAA